MMNEENKTSFSVKRKKVIPNKPKNKDRRAREYLTYQEVEKLRKGVQGSNYAHRNDTIILLMFRHALRVGEVCVLRWEQIDLKKGLLYVNRLKSGIPSIHPSFARR